MTSVVSQDGAPTMHFVTARPSQLASSRDLRAAQTTTSPCRLGFALFLLVNGVLFVRPADLFPELGDWPIYQCVILLCLAVSVPAVLPQLSLQSLRRNPITVCVISLLPAIMLSHVSHGDFYDARIHVEEFLKVVIYYLLLVGLLNSSARLKAFLLVFCGFVLCTATLSLMNHHGVINLPALADFQQSYGETEVGDTNYIPRLRAMGIFNDPNDFCLILNAAIFICMHWMFQQRNWLLRIAWLIPISWLGYAVVLTQSRGGLLSLLAGLLVFIFSRLSWSKAIILSAILVPTILMSLGGRITDIDLSDADDTAQGRVLIWRDCLALFHQVPLFGSGYDTLSDEIDFVAHNSFIHCYTELGFFGGTLFVSMFYLGIRGLRRLGSARVHHHLPPELRSMPLCLLPVIVSYACGLYSLSRSYGEATYLMIGVLSVMFSLSLAAGVESRRFDPRLVRTLIAVSAICVIFFELFVRVVAE
jgi:O-antigen ligase